MGYSLSWLAVKGMPPQTVLNELNFRPIGEREEFAESDLSAVEMPNGWYVIVSNRSEQVASEAQMQRLSSADAELVTCFVEEHVMVSAATGWKAGRKIWSVIHNTQKYRGHLDAQGDLPPSFNSILAEMKAKQQQADAHKRNVDFIFEVPVALARTLVGYTHDQDIPGLSGPVFEVLAGIASNELAVPPLNRSIFKRLFGR